MWWKPSLHRRQEVDNDGAKIKVRLRSKNQVQKVKGWIGKGGNSPFLPLYYRTKEPRYKQKGSQDSATGTIPTITASHLLSLGMKNRRRGEDIFPLFSQPRGRRNLSLLSHRQVGPRAQLGNFQKNPWLTTLITSLLIVVRFFGSKRMCLKRARRMPGVCLKLK